MTNDVEHTVTAHTTNTDYMQYSTVLLSYKGLVTENIIAELGNVIRKLFFHNPKVCGKLFSIFIEAATNVYNYSDEKIITETRTENIGSFEIGQDTNCYFLRSTNMIHNEYLEELTEGCNIINTLDRDGLRQYKREQRNMPQKKRSKGAGIGLIQIALIAESVLHIKVKQFNHQFSHIELSVEIKK